MIVHLKLSDGYEKCFENADVEVEEDSTKVSIWSKGNLMAIVDKGDIDLLLVE